MLNSVKKVVKYSTKIASSTKNKVEKEVGKFVKKHKIPINEGKALVGKIIHELKNDKDRMQNFILNELRKEIKEAKPYVKRGKKFVKKVGKKAKKAAKLTFRKAKKKTKRAAKRFAKAVVKKRK